MRGATQDTSALQAAQRASLDDVADVQVRSELQGAQKRIGLLLPSLQAAFHDSASSDTKVNGANAMRALFEICSTAARVESRSEGRLSAEDENDFWRSNNPYDMLQQPLAGGVSCDRDGVLGCADVLHGNIDVGMLAGARVGPHDDDDDDDE